MPEHKAKALLITCMDFRFIDAFYAEASTLHIMHHYDRVALAGDVKNLVKPENPADSELLMRQIDISKNLHKVDQVVLMSHEDCGAYPELKGLTPDQELLVHVADLESAKEMILERHPDLCVYLYYATIKEENGENVIRFSKIEDCNNKCTKCKPLE